MIKLINSNRKKTFLVLLIGVFGIGFSPAIVKALGLEHVGPSAIGFWRNFFGFTFLFLISFLRKQKLILSKNSFIWAIFAGLFFALDLNFWHRSVMYAGSGISTVIGNTQVFITSIVSVYLFKEKLTMRFLFAAFVAIIGVVMLAGLIDNDVNISALYLKGIFYAVLTAFMYSFYLLSMKKSGKDCNLPAPEVFMAWISLFSAIFLFFLSFFDHGNFFPKSYSSIFLLICLGVGVQGICWWLIAYAMVKIETYLASLILLLQPAIAVFWGYIFFAENLTYLQILGVIVTLIAVYAGSFTKKIKTEKST